MYDVAPSDSTTLPFPFVMTPLLMLRRTLAGTTQSVAAPIAQAVGAIAAQHVQVTLHLSSVAVLSATPTYPVAFGGLRYGTVARTHLPLTTIPPAVLHLEMQRLANECRDLVQFLALLQWQRWQRTQDATRQQEQVTARERDILLHCFAGHSRQAIAMRLCIAPTTVKTHLRNLYAKLGVHSMQEALAVGRAAGLLLHLL